MPQIEAVTQAASLPEGIEVQHRAIRRVVDSLAACEDLGVAITLLQRLDALLAVHFNEEEAPGGLLEDMLNSAQFQDRAVDNLRHEHELIARENREILAAARACIAGPVAEVLRRSKALCGTIQAHERRETDAYLDAIYAEAGGSG